MRNSFFIVCTLAFYSYLISSGDRLLRTTYDIIESAPTEKEALEAIAALAKADREWFKRGIFEPREYIRCRSLLHAAAKSNPPKPKTMLYLLQQGVRHHDVFDETDRTPLHWLLYKREETSEKETCECIKHLLEHGADMNAQAIESQMSLPVDQIWRCLPFDMHNVFAGYIGPSRPLLTRNYYLYRDMHNTYWRKIPEQLSQILTGYTCGDVAEEIFQYIDLPPVPEPMKDQNPDGKVRLDVYQVP